MRRGRRTGYIDLEKDGMEEVIGEYLSSWEEIGVKEKRFSFDHDMLFLLISLILWGLVMKDGPFFCCFVFLFYF